MKFLTLATTDRLVLSASIVDPLLSRSFPATKVAPARRDEPVVVDPTQPTLGASNGCRTGSARSARFHTAHELGVQSHPRGADSTGFVGRWWIRCSGSFACASVGTATDHRSDARQLQPDVVGEGVVSVELGRSSRCRSLFAARSPLRQGRPPSRLPTTRRQTTVIRAEILGPKQLPGSVDQRCMVGAPVRSVPSGRCKRGATPTAGRHIERRTAWSHLDVHQIDPVVPEQGAH